MASEGVGDDTSSFAGEEGGGGRGEGEVVPLFSEYPGQNLNEQLDLDHFWSAVNMFFPDDHSPAFLQRIRLAVLPVEAPVGGASDDDHPIFRFPRVQGAKYASDGESGGREEKRIGSHPVPRREKSSSSSTDEEGKREEEEEESVWALDDLDDIEEGSLSEASYEGDEERPAEAFLVQLKRRLRLRQQEQESAALASDVTSISLEGKAARDRSSSSSNGGRGRDIEMIFQTQANGQQRILSSYRATRPEHSTNGPGEICSTDLELLTLEKEGGPTSSSSSSSPSSSSAGTQQARTTINVEIVQPSYVDLELMSHQQELHFVSNALRHRVDGMMSRMLSDAEKKQRQKDEAGTIERRYLLARAWKFVAQGLNKGLQDQNPDFNKHKEEVLPASWTVPVDGRPPPPTPEAVVPGVEGVEVDDSICMVCFDGSSTENNEIVFCDGCNVAIHQACYGLPEVPEGDFYCEKCLGLMENPERPIVCALCPEVHGGFKRTVDGKWVHLVCALVCPGARITNLMDMGPVDLSGASAIIKRPSASSPLRHPPPPLVALQPPDLPQLTPALLVAAATNEIAAQGMRTTTTATVEKEEISQEVTVIANSKGNRKANPCVSASAAPSEGEDAGEGEKKEEDWGRSQQQQKQQQQHQLQQEEISLAAEQPSFPATFAATCLTDETTTSTLDKQADDELNAVLTEAAAAIASSPRLSSPPLAMTSSQKIAEKRSSPSPTPTSIARRSTRSSPAISGRVSRASSSCSVSTVQRRPDGVPEEKASAAASEKEQREKMETDVASPAKREGKGEVPEVVMVEDGDGRGVGGAALSSATQPPREAPHMEVETAAMTESFTPSTASSSALVVSAAPSPKFALAPNPTHVRVDQCIICSQSRGHTLQCLHEGCRARFHLLCAWFRGAFVSVDLTDRSFWGHGKNREDYPAGLHVRAYCLQHCPQGAHDRLEQVQLRAKYRLKENDQHGPKRHHAYKKRAYTYGGMQGGKSLGGHQGLNPDSYHRYACAICMEPKAKLVESTDKVTIAAATTVVAQELGGGVEVGETKESAKGRPDSLKTSAAKAAETAEGALIVCSRCDMSVHRTCYSYFQEPPTRTSSCQAEWLCQTCVGEQQDLGSGGSCALCPRRGGLLVPTNDRNIRWVHAFCAEHNGPLVFKAGRSPILSQLAAVDIRNVGKEAKKASKCGVCSRKNSGLCLRCAHPSCSVQFHPLCAKLDGWYFEAEPRGEAPVVLCPGHVPHGVYRGLNGQYFDMKTTANLRKNLDRARLIIDLVRKREKVKKALWKADCDLALNRLQKLRVLLEGRVLEMQNGRRLTEDRLAVYRKELGAIKARSVGAQEAEEEEALFKEADLDDRASAAAAAITAAAAIEERKKRSLQGKATDGGEAGGAGTNKRPRPDLSLIPSGRPVRRSRNTPQDQSAASSVCDTEADEAGGGGPLALAPVENVATSKRGGNTLAAASTDSSAVSISSPQSSAAEVTIHVPAFPLSVKKYQKKVKAEKEKLSASSIASACPPLARGKAAAAGKSGDAATAQGKTEMEEAVEEEEEEEDALLARDRFEALTEERGMIAAEALGKTGSLLWAAAGTRVGACGRVDFEKSLGLIVDPEDLRRREKRGQPPAPGRVVGDARISLDRQLLELVSALEDCKDGSGRDVSATFELSPDPETYPEYYDAVLHPMDLETLRHRVLTFFYLSMSDFCKDVQQIVRNAKKFNAPRSQTYMDAEFLRTFFERKKAEVLEREKKALAALHHQERQEKQGMWEGGADGDGRARRRRLGGGDGAADVGGFGGSGSVSGSMEAKQKGKRKGIAGGGNRVKRNTRSMLKKERVCLVCSAGGDDSVPVVGQGPCHACAECVQQRPEAFLGHQVDVLWPDDDMWYAGKIHDYDRLSGQHRIWYDDGEWEFVHLHEEELSYLVPVVFRPAKAASPANASEISLVPLVKSDAIPKGKVGGGRRGSAKKEAPKEQGEEEKSEKEGGVKRKVQKARFEEADTSLGAAAKSSSGEGAEDVVEIDAIGQEQEQEDEEETEDEM